MYKYCDIHIHPTLKPYNSIANSHRRNAENTSLNFRRADFEKIKKSNSKLVWATLYPFEQGWFVKPNREKADTKNYKEGKKYLSSNPLWQFFTIAQRIETIISPDYNYFNELLGEYDFLEKEIKKHSDNTSEFVLPLDKNQLTGALSSNDKIIVIPTIEGSHALLNGNYYSIYENKIKYEQVHHNIDILKNKGSNKRRMIFSITFSHHFNNGLGGHAKSLYKLKKLTDQSYGKGDPISKEGWKVIKHLLAIDQYKNHGYRILIDTKHMSKAARMEYYSFLNDYNRDKNDEEKIPVISSHSAYAGVKSIYHIGNYSGQFCNYEVNLADDELIYIYKNNGILGLNMDQAVLGYNENPRGSTELIADNILAMAEVLANEFDNAKIWDIFALGSDFDGYINPVDKYDDITKYPILEKDLIKYFENSILFDKLSYGLSPSEVVEKIMGKNAIEFTVKNYPHTDSPIA